MTAPAPCPDCTCDAACPVGLSPRALLAALHEGDVDRALTLGLLHCNGCGDCTRACSAGVAVAETLVTARDERLRALAARERYRARALRMERRAVARAAKRVPAATAGDAMPPATTVGSRPPLPSAAAAVLARAKAKAAERGKP